MARQRPRYQKPGLYPLNPVDALSVSGRCDPTGSSDSGICDAGNRAGQQCQANGAAAGQHCQSNGQSAVSHCAGTGQGPSNSCSVGNYVNYPPCTFGLAASGCGSGFFIG